MSKFNELIKINVNDKVEKKEGLSYLSWAFAWAEFKKVFPEAQYEVVKDANNLPYFESSAGAMVYTKVTADNLTYEMWLPVMDSRNKAMKSSPYEYNTSKGKRSVEAFTMFDVNKTIMRCLVKNLAMFGLALYIFAGEDLPAEEEVSEEDLANYDNDIVNAENVDQLLTIFKSASTKYPRNTEFLTQVRTACGVRKQQIIESLKND